MSTHHPLAVVPYLRQMKIKGIILILILTISCSSRQLTLEQYANQSVKFEKQKISYPNNDFTLFIPKEWEWKVEDYDNLNIILGIDASSKPDKDGFIDVISVQKITSFGGNRDLKSEFDYLLDLTKKQSKSMRIIESGKTNILKQKAYFIHTKSDTGTYGESLTISFILDSGTDGVFYYLNAGASQTTALNKNMAILIQSLKAFETNRSE